MKRASSLFTILLVCAGATSASAQSTAGINSGIQFDFALPGARSLGMAGAFVSLADDATASQANPAGLSNLGKAELAFEGRFWNFFSASVLRGHVFGNASNVGIDTITGEVTGEIRDTTGAPSFVSFVKPFGSWAVAGHRHQFAKFRNSVETDGAFVRYDNTAIRRTNPSFGDIELDIVNWGASVSRRLGDRLSVGGTLTFSQFDIASYGAAYILDPFDRPTLTPAQAAAFTGTGQAFGPPDTSANKLFFEEYQEGESSGWSWTVGILFEPVAKWRVGGAFRKGAEFEYDARFLAGPAHGAIPSPFTPGQVVDSDADILFHVPDSVAGGVTYLPNDAVRVSFEYSFVKQSQIMNGTGTGLPVDTAGRLQAADPAVREEGRLIQEGLTVDDVHQLRFGGEWRFRNLTNGALFVRGGAWYDPNHSVYFVDRENRQADIPNLRALEATFPKRGDAMHVGAGFGATFDKWGQIDVALDVSPRVNTFSVSTVINRFRW
jgi:long-chain fatty acid transport protein